MKKTSIILSCIIALVALAMWVPNANAFESYHDPGLNDDGYCSSAACHPGFTGGRSDVTHALHTGGGNPITSNCDLCHTGSGRDNPLTLWSTYNVGAGYGCTGCHGRDYGETIETDYLGFPIAGLPKASGWGLRRAHDLAGVTECIACHGDMVPLAENIQPPYYADPASESNVTDPCSDNLDNDGDGMLDAMDPDCTGAVCGDGTQDPGEDCDDGTANGATTCGCQTDCTLPSAGTSCADGEFCNGDETCDGAGACQAGTPVDCSDGVSCTDDACNEAADICVNTPNNANCPDDGAFCNGVEVCDPFADCSSAGDPCQPGTVCNEVTDTCDQQAQCGDGNLDSGEECDAGAANGTTECGCQNDCTYTPVDSPCGDQGIECRVDDTCDGMGACTDNGNQPDGTTCGDSSDTQCDNPDSCLAGACEPNNEPSGVICEDGEFCTVSDACDGSGTCAGGVDSPCFPGETCDETNDQCVPPAEGDAWLDQMRAPKKKRLTESKQQVNIDVIAKGSSTVNQTVTMSLTGTPSDPNVFVGVLNSPVSQMVQAGDGRTSFPFNADLKCNRLDGMTYQVSWLAKIEAAEQNSDLTNDTVTKTTDVVCVGGAGQAEICDDGMDNDGDRKVDCADKKDCRTDPACQ